MHKKYYKTDNRKAFYDARIKDQNGCCAICGMETRLVIDHDHETGIMRGLLCYTHNTALGMFADNPELLVRAAEYLKEHNIVAYKKTKRATDPYKNYLKAKELIPSLLKDPKYISDRARARELAKLTGCKESTAQTRICRARKNSLTTTS